MSAAIRKLEEGFTLIIAGLRALQDEDEWIDQNNSPLGRARHLAAVRAGELAGRKVGRAILVRKTELDAYIERHGSRVIKTAPATEDEEIDRVLAYKARPSRRRKAG